MRSLPRPEIDGGSRSKPVMDDEKLADSGVKPRSRPGRTVRGLPSMGTDGESPPSELEIDGDKLAETGDER